MMSHSMHGFLFVYACGVIKVVTCTLSIYMLLFFLIDCNSF